MIYNLFNSNFSLGLSTAGTCRAGASNWAATATVFSDFDGLSNDFFLRATSSTRAGIH